MTGRKQAGLTAAAIAAFLISTVGVGTGLGRSADSHAPKARDVPRKARVVVHDNYFEPRSTEILEDGEVLWRWKGENKHSIRFTKVPSGARRRGAGLRVEGKWKRKFHRVGVYRYVCTQWSGMRGSISVRKAPKPAPPRS
jgi:plastocyanin